MDKSVKTPTSSHGLRFTFTSKQISQYSNNSLNKTQYISTKQKSRMESLKKETEKIKISKEYHKNLRGRLAQLKTDQSLYKEKVKETDELLETQNKAAVVIQKFARGYLLRKKIDDEWHAMKKEKLIEMVTEMDNSHNRFIYNVGKMPLIAAVVIQRAVRRHFFYKKILRIKKVYLYMLDLKEQETYKLIRSVLKNLYCMKRVNTLKFEKFRNKRLAAIKNKLALLNIKSVFAREKMSWKIVRIRIRKFKRNMKVPPKKPIGRKGTLIMEADKQITKKLTDKKPEIVIKKSESPDASPRNTEPKNKDLSSSTIFANEVKPIITELKVNVENIDSSQVNPEVANKDQLQPEGQFLQPSLSQETIVTTTTEREERVREEFLRKLEEERKVKVALGRISYGVRQKDTDRLLPYLKTVSGVEPDFPLPSKQEKKEKAKEKKVFEKLPESPNKSTNRKYVPGSYMKETQAYQFSKMCPEEIYYEEESITVPIKVRNNSTLMTPTAAFIQKTSGNPSARSHSTETKAAEKLIIASKKFRSNILLEIPEQPEKPEKPSSPAKKIPVLLRAKQPKPLKTDMPEIPIINNHRVSISFTEALPEYSEFLTQYQKTPKKAKLDPILPKSSKIKIFDSHEFT